MLSEVLPAEVLLAVVLLAVVLLSVGHGTAALAHRGKAMLRTLALIPDRKRDPPQAMP